jgi:hypothetical protein
MQDADEAVASGAQAMLMADVARGAVLIVEGTRRSGY